MTAESRPLSNSSATRHALDAGFDGVELHAASGYLPEQFLSSSSNQRNGKYGGSVENRARFVVEVLEAMIAEAGSDLVGIKISPKININGTTDANSQETYAHLIGQLYRLNLAYLIDAGRSCSSSAAITIVAIANMQLARAAQSSPTLR